MIKQTSTARSQFLMDVADLRSGIIRSDAAPSLEQRLSELCDFLLMWTKLPKAALPLYGRAVFEGVFRAAEHIEDDPVLDDDHRAIIELSLWQAITDLRLNELDRGRAHFIAKRQDRLLNHLELRTTSSILRLLYKWSSLLRPRPDKIRELPGPYRADLALIITELVNAGIPRRAKAIAGKFQLSVDSLVLFAIKHRSEEDEIARTKALLDRLISPPQPIPYTIRVRSRALIRVLSAPLAAIPLSISSTGITIHTSLGNRALF